MQTSASDALRRALRTSMNRHWFTRMVIAAWAGHIPLFAFLAPVSIGAFTDPAQATVYASSGVYADEQADGFMTSVDPLIQVRSNDGKTIPQQLAESDPPLQMITEPL